MQPPITIDEKPRTQFLGDGRLYLTNKRLIWRRRWFNLPLIPVRSFEVPLIDIRDCKLVGSGPVGFILYSSIGLRPLYIITETQKHLLHINAKFWPPTLWFSKVRTEEWQEAILNAARPRAP